MKYREATQKEIKLPSGGIVTVRRQTKYELILIGSPPAFFMRNASIRERAGQAKTEAERAEIIASIQETTEAETIEWMKYMMRQNGVLLSRCCVTPIEKDGESVRIVNKEPGETGQGEISWAMVDDADVEAILNAVNELEDKTGREAVATFPEKPESTQRDRHTGATLPCEPVGTAAAVA